LHNKAVCLQLLALCTTEPIFAQLAIYIFLHNKAIYSFLHK